MRKDKGFNLVSTIIIIVVTAIISGITTGTIMYNGYRQSTGLTYGEIAKDPALTEFLEVYSSILDEYYEDIDKEAMLEEAMAAMMDYLGDSYTTYLTEEETEALVEKLAGEYRGVGISIQGNLIVGVTKNSPAEKVGIKVNDEIIRIDNAEVTELGSNAIVAMIKNSNKESVSIVVKRNDQEIEFNIKLSTLYVPAIASEIIEKNNKKIGYIYIDTFSNTLGRQIEDKLSEFESAKIDSLIIDVRDNSGGYLTAASDVASLFLEKGTIIYSLEDKNKKNDYVDETSASESYEMIVLINKNSASASEILAAALKESYGATLLGETSYGKGKVQQTLSLKDGSMVKYTSAKWYTPNGTCIDEIGLVPDVAVDNEFVYADEEQTLITEIIDKQLPAAIELLSK